MKPVTDVRWLLTTIFGKASQLGFGTLANLAMKFPDPLNVEGDDNVPDGI